jgi:choline kinase
MVNLRSNLSMSLRTHVLPRPYSDSLLCPEQWKSKILNRKLKTFYFNTYTFTHSSTQLTNMIETLFVLNEKTDKEKCWILLANFKIYLEGIIIQIT